MDKNILDTLSKININNIDFNNHSEVKSIIIALFNVIVGRQIRIITNCNSTSK